MALSIDDLFTPLTSDEIRATMVTELVALDIPADEWRAGGVASTMLTVTAIMLAMASTIIATVIQGFFLPTATGTGLVLLARYVYGVEVPEATYATGDVLLTNTGGGVYSKAAGEYTALNPTTRQTYVNTAAFVLGALGTATVPMRATEAGSAGSATPNTITESVTSLLGVTVTNPASFVGVDAPNDVAIRQLCLNKLGILSVRGVRTAYAYAIQTATNPVTLGPVNINRWSISESSHFGTVDLFVAAPSGTPDPNDIIGVETRIEEVARPAAVEVTVTGATEVPYDPTIIVYVTPFAGTLQASIQASVDAEIASYIANFPISGVTALDDQHGSPFTGLFGEGVASAIAKGVQASGSVLLSVKGATDLALAAGEVATDEVTTTIVLIAPSSGVLL